MRGDRSLHRQSSSATGTVQCRPDVILTIGNHMMDCWAAATASWRCTTPSPGWTKWASRTPARTGSEGRTDAGCAQCRHRRRTRNVRLPRLRHLAPWYAATEDRAGTAPLEPEYVRRDISAARRLADHVIVGANWGVEYTSNPIAFQRDIAGVAMGGRRDVPVRQPSALGPSGRALRRPACRLLVRQLHLRPETGRSRRRREC